MSASRRRVVVNGIGALLFLCLGIVLGYGLRGYFGTQQQAFFEIREGDSQFAFTNPLLECRELPETISIGTRKQLKDDIQALIDSYKARGEMTEASVYFRDLNNGPWFGIQEGLEFSPASLLKVPLAMWYFAEADRDPGILGQEIEFKGPRGTSIVHFPPRTVLQENQVYTIEELIRRMLQESDNDAAFILSQFAGQDVVAVYRDLGVSPDQLSYESNIDVHTYASFFRILFNSTYLQRSLSERMLEMMSESSFEKGIVAGVPSHIRVAHKFGEKVIDAKGVVQLHDCGIVYVPGTPYTLCIMTQGADYETLSAFIRDVSALVYQEISD